MPVGECHYGRSQWSQTWSPMPWWGTKKTPWKLLSRPKQSTSITAVFTDRVRSVLGQDGLFSLLDLYSLMLLTSAFSQLTASHLLTVRYLCPSKCCLRVDPLQEFVTYTVVVVSVKSHYQDLALFLGYDTSCFCYHFTEILKIQSSAFRLPDESSFGFM